MAKILVVDDDASLLKLTQVVLENAGYEVVATTDPEKAVALAEAEAVDAAVLDVVMPSRSGLEVLNDLRRRPHTMDIPVLMLSAMTDGSDRVRGLRLGAEDYLAKPLEPEELLLKLNRALATSTAQSAKLGGAIGHFSLAEVLQTLYQGSRRGTLVVYSEGLRGEIKVWDGCLDSASWEDLQAADAVFAMTQLRSGRFRFEPTSPQDAGEPEDTLRLVPLIDVLMNIAWTDDQLSKLPQLPPETCLHPRIGAETLQLDARGGFANLPLQQTLEAVRSRPGIRLEELLRLGIAAPQRVRLAAMLLAEKGVFTVG